MVRDHPDDLDRQIARMPAMKKVIEAVARFGARDQKAGPFGGRDQLPIESEPGRHRLETGAQRGKSCRKARAGALELDSHEEAASIEIGILLAVEDETVGLCQPAAHSGNDPVAVLA